MTESTEARAGRVRREYIAGLRQLANLLERQEDIPTPYTANRAASSVTAIDIFAHGRQMETVELLRAQLGRPAAVEMRGTTMWITWHLDGVAIRANIAADKVAKKVVVASLETAGRTIEQVQWVLAKRFQPAPASDAAEGATDA